MSKDAAMTEEREWMRAGVGVAQLADSTGERMREQRTDVAVEAFRNTQLWKAAMDEPWDTSLAWADAQTDFAFADLAELDSFVSQALLQLFDDGFAYFFEVTDFGESYSRTPEATEWLTHAELVEALTMNRDAGPGDGEASLAAPFLGFRATEEGRERVFSLWPEDRKRWESYRE